MKKKFYFFIIGLIYCFSIPAYAGQVSAEFSDSSTKLLSKTENKIPLLNRKFDYKNRVSAQNFVKIKYKDNESPDQVAWWLRAQYNPYSAKIQGIYVNKIDPTWCYANEFKKDLFPSELNEDLDDANFSFTDYYYLYPQTITRITVTTGVYERCNGQKGVFALVFDESKKNKTIIQLEQFDSNNSYDGIILLYKGIANRGFSLYFCFSCDVNVNLQWNKNRSNFIYASASSDLDGAVWKDLISNEELELEGLQFYLHNFPNGVHSDISKLYLNHLKYAVKSKSKRQLSKNELDMINKIVLEKNLNFRKFKLLEIMNKHPKSEIFRESLYNLGIAEYANSECEAAYFSLNTFAKAYPKDARTPIALLYSGQSLIRAGLDTQRNIYRLMEIFPESKESISAKKLLADSSEFMKEFENKTCW
jgi:hypothetical protein